MQKILYLLLLICFTFLPSIAADWVQIPDTTTYFDKESIKKEGHNIYSIETKSPADNGLEYRNIFVIMVIHKNLILVKLNYLTLKIKRL